jgi:hypothetical protein
MNLDLRGIGMNFDLSCIGQFKVIYASYFMHSTLIHIYIKKDTWKRYEEDRIVLLYNEPDRIMKVIKVSDNDIDFKGNFSLDKSIGVIFIDKDTSYLYIEDKLFEIFANMTGRVMSIDYLQVYKPIKIFDIVRDMKDEELKEIINSYSILEEFI